MLTATAFTPEGPVTVLHKDAPLPTLARTLLKRSLASRRTLLNVFRRDQRVFKPIQVGVLADRTYSERGSSIRIEKYRPFKGK